VGIVVQAVNNIKINNSLSERSDELKMSRTQNKKENKKENNKFASKVKDFFADFF
jgi:hypothetical protein